MDGDSNDNININLTEVSKQTTTNEADNTTGIVNPSYGADLDEVHIRDTSNSGDVNKMEKSGLDMESGAKDEDDSRETWGKKVDFLLSAVGFAVDLANVWRFPYLCYRNGGGAFLIPYVIFLIFGGIPMLYLEMSLGQYHRTGTISVWSKICPLFKGVGWTVVLIAWYVAFYYNVIIAWAVFYLFSSFTSELPWSDCDHSWNTPDCYDNSGNTTNTTTGSSAADEFYNRAVLGIHRSTGIDDMAGINWQLLLCFMGVLLVVFLTIFRGVKTSGKVVWVTATLPYIVITILLIRGCTLPGSTQGIKYYLTPDFTTLASPYVWIDAAIQIFYSIGAGFGVHIAFASYNKFSNNIYRDVLLTSSINCLTSFFSGFAIFAVLGYMSEKFNRPIDEVATDGPGLVFVVYPEAIATLPGAPGWAIIFYLMLITLGLDSSFGGTEAVITGLTDKFPSQLKNKRVWVAAGVLGSVFLFGLFNVTYGGLYVLTLEDTHFAGSSLLFGVTIEAIAIAWFYGLGNFTADVKEMLGFEPGWWWRFCWKIAAPLFLVFILIVSFVLSAPLALDDYVYPTWANVVGWLLALSSMVLIPIYAVYELAKAEGDSLKEKFLYSITPVEDRLPLGEGDRQRLEIKHWLSL